MPTETETGRTVAPRFECDREHDGGMIDRAASRAAAMTPAQRTERINRSVRQYLPYVLIVLVPVLALVFKLVYWKRRLLYGEHLVVAFHAQTVAFIFAIASVIPMGDLIGSLWDRAGRARCGRAASRVWRPLGADGRT